MRYIFVNHVIIVILGVRTADDSSVEVLLAWWDYRIPIISRFFPYSHLLSCLLGEVTKNHVLQHNKKQINPASHMD